jgi:putative sigma-54 modulation protein
MRVEVTFRNLSASKSLQAYATSKVERLSRFLIKGIDAHVVLSKDGFRNVAECTMRDSGGTLAAKEESEEDMYAAIDGLVDKLAVQARRRKSKLKSHRANSLSGTLGEMEALQSAERGADLDADLDAMGD